jgi:hypothetical protein
VHEVDTGMLEGRRGVERDAGAAALAERQPDQTRVNRNRSLADTTVTSTSPFS